MTRFYLPAEINTMSYTDFVGLVNQWNVPPGSYNTLSKWRVFSDITNESNILEVACTTGFSSREIALMTDANVIGIDLSEKSAESASFNASKFAPEIKGLYLEADVMTYETTERFSHIIIGAALRFFPDPTQTMQRLIGWLNDGGYILSTEFYCISDIPKGLIDEAKEVFGIEITQQGYKDIMKPYRNLTLLYEDRNVIYAETDNELDYYCSSTIEKFSELNPGYSTEALGSMKSRLLKIKDMSNRLRPYQNYNVLVHKLDKRYYPHRYTELF